MIYLKNTKTGIERCTYRPYGESLSLACVILGYDPSKMTRRAKECRLWDRGVLVYELDGNGYVVESNDFTIDANKGA